MRRLTLCLPYYLNPGMLQRQFEWLRAMPEAVLNALAVIVVDDGSPVPAVGEPIGCPLKIFRVGVDIRWNQDAARNIAVHESTSTWLLLTDIDHLVPAHTFLRALQSLDVGNVYRFSRQTLVNDRQPLVLSPYKPHPNSWLMTRTMYDRIGGYDERFAGHYGTDADFRDRVVATAIKVELLKEFLIRVPREVIPDASTTTYTRKGDPFDAGAIRRIKAERAQDPAWTPRRLSFPYRWVSEFQ